MARSTFGGTTADTVAQRVRILGHDVDDYTSATLTVWSAQTGGTQYTDLLVNGAASNSVPVDATGQVPEFQGPDGVTIVWVSAGGARVKMLPAEGPSDAGVAGYVNDSASSTRAALNGRYVAHGDLVLNVKDYGAKGDATTDDTAAIQAALNAVSTTYGGTVYFPPGQYQISSTLNITKSETKLLGTAGNGSRIAVTADVDAVKFTGVSRCSIRNLWIGAFAARTAGYGIMISGVQGGTHCDYLDMENVTVQNTYGGIWCAWLQQSAWRNIRVIRSLSSGISGNPLYFIGCKSFRLSDFWLVTSTTPFPTSTLVLDSECDTMLLTNGEIGASAGTAGVSMTNSLGGSNTGPRLVHLKNLFVERCTLDGYNIDSGRFIRITDCEASANTRSGFLIAGGDGVTITGCESNQNGRHGYYFAGTTGPFSLIGSTANYNSQEADAGYHNIQVDPSVADVRIIGNRAGCWLYSLTNKPSTGIRISAGADNVTVVGNDVRGNKNAGILNQSTATHNRVSQNNGYNPVGKVGPPAVPATTVAYTNAYGVDCNVYVAGGTVTAVAIGGNSTGATSGTFRVPSGQTITLTYSVAPTWTWFGD